MSNEPRTAFSEARGQNAIRSVYDFLYRDAERIASLLAQFDPNGVLQSLTTTESFSDTADSGNETAGAVSLAAVKGQYKTSERISELAAAGASRAYDPLWSNPLNLLDFLHQHGYLNRELKNARLGQIVLVSGALSVYDVPVLKVLLSEPDVARKTIESQEGKKTGQQWAETKALLKLFASLPLSVQAVLEVDGDKIWTIIENDNLQISSSNLFLKYGTAIPGDWNMLGILDALPTPPGEEVLAPPELGSIVDVLGKMANISEKLGRPRTAFGLTPLLIFRKLHTLEMSLS